MCARHGTCAVDSTKLTAFVTLAALSVTTGGKPRNLGISHSSTATRKTLAMFSAGKEPTK